MTSGQWIRHKRLAVGVTVLLALLLGGLVGLALQQSMLNIKRGAARDLGFAYSQRIAQRLQEAVGPAYMLASRVQQGGGRIDDFDAVGEQLLEAFPLARAVELAPAGVVRKVYPLQGNESIIGHDLLKDRERNREAHTAVARRQLTVAGPFELIQGGAGVVGRYPVFLSESTGRSSFWGFTIVLIRVPELLNAAGIAEISREGYRYELCRVPPTGGDCAVFAQHGEGRLDTPVMIPIDVPNGHWQLMLAPEGGWVSGSERLLLGSMVVVLALLLGGLQYLFLRNLQKAF